MIIIPENIIRNVVRGILGTIDNNIRTSLENESILYSIFGDLEHDKLKYYDQAVAMFDQGNTRSRKIRTKLAFDTDFSQPPIIFITTSKDSHNMSSVGAHDSTSTDYIGNITRRDASCILSGETNIVIVSDSMEEVLIMYNVIRAMLIAAVDHITLSGIQNMKLGGADITIDQEMIPKNIFMRTISVSYDYSVTVPSLTRGDGTLIDLIYTDTEPTDAQVVDPLTLYNFCDQLTLARLTQPQMDCLRLAFGACAPSEIILTNTEGNVIDTFNAPSGQPTGRQVASGVVVVVNTQGDTVLNFDVAAGEVMAVPAVLANVSWTNSDGSPESTPYGESIVSTLCPVPVATPMEYDYIGASNVYYIGYGLPSYTGIEAITIKRVTITPSTGAVVEAYATDTWNNHLTATYN